MKKLVAYFSATGTTQTLAENLANGLMFIFRAKSRIFFVKYRFEKGMPFQKKVWHLIENIAFGKTSSYGDIACSLARQMGKQKMSAQAVGKAVGANPICIIVPCHRVVGKTGKLTGYGGGIENIKQLLLLEKTEKEKF